MATAVLNVPETLRQWRATLAGVATRARAEAEKRYLKSRLTFLGVTVPQLRRQAQAFCRRQPELNAASLRALAKGAFATEVHELRSMALFVLQQRVQLLAPADLTWIEAIVRACDGWAHLDTLAIHVVGPVVEQRPAAARARLRRWARDDSFWVRRAALLALLEPLRQGAGQWTLFEQLATPLLGEREFFIRKAIGWVLRETSKKRPAVVARFLDQHEAQISGLTRREASKYLSVAGRPLQRRPKQAPAKSSRAG